jgi:hypothetical protein
MIGEPGFHRGGEASHDVWVHHDVMALIFWVSRCHWQRVILPRS